MSAGLRLLTTYFSIIEARICLSKLDAYGVYALAPLAVVSVAPHWMTMHGGVPVWVFEQDLEAARALLAAVEEEGTPKAPRRRILEGISGVLLIFFFGLPPGPSPAFARSQLWFSGTMAVVLALIAFLHASQLGLV